LTKAALRSFVMRHPFLLKVREEILDPEMETILHPSPLRLKWLGIFTLIVHPLFWFIWVKLFPQPYENLAVRVFLAFAGIGLLFQPFMGGVNSVITRRYFSVLSWVQLPVFTMWMYWMNGGDSVWLTTMAIIIVGYYHLTDWRMATPGLVTAIGVSALVAYLQLGRPISLPAVDAIVLAFAWIVAISLAMSSANLRRERIKHSLAVIGIMAHELRTPLATASMISQAIRTEAGNPDEVIRTKRLEKLAVRLESLAHSINHHIDLQMFNARLMQLPPAKQLISAVALVNSVTKTYPYGAPGEQQCVEIIVHKDFHFMGSDRQFTQVLNNLLKNALYSLHAAQSRHSAGDLRIEIGQKSGIGKITIKDKGMGISAENQQRIFEPFFSTSHDTGHGLGLAYCRQVVQNAGGFIRVKSEAMFGATFTIDLPAHAINIPHKPSHAISSLPPA
jgi:two-component system, CAI-1 autoinducer sensor kinase/phosphatase CqsS